MFFLVVVVEKEKTHKMTMSVQRRSISEMSGKETEIKRARFVANCMHSYIEVLFDDANDGCMPMFELLFSLLLLLFFSFPCDGYTQYIHMYVHVHTV